ncbi:hypothetical protein KVR01_002213 [Diaporthe batatas]|uniref:uncharacterized protein n=1 Tax=Diaporthe batatas TaxID=748121 RepID=UPI001D03ADBA|nr:uncharacterized protein KVR01_002213 [Diaporthe batatas]KAG8166524.1 hypothetical protein KVR01_002213 [Diaporthe batatas]
MDPQRSLGDVPRSSITVFDLGYRPGSQQRFLDQVDMGVNLGGLVRRVPLSAEPSAELSAKRNQVHHLLNQLRLSHDAAKLDLQDFISEEEELGNDKKELQGDLIQHAKLVEEAYERGDFNTAMGLEQAHKNLRVNLAVRLRGLSQKASELAEAMKATRKKLSEIELDTIRAKQRLHVIEARLLPASNLTDALNA